MAATLIGDGSDPLIPKGRLTIDTTKTVKGSDLLNLMRYADMASGDVAAEMGIAGVRHKLERTSQAADDPKKYLKDVDDQLVRVENKVREDFKNYYSELVSLGVAPSVAREKAVIYTKALAEIELAKVKMDFPGALVDNAVENIHKKFNAVKGNDVVGIKGISKPLSITY